MHIYLFLLIIFSLSWLPSCEKPEETYLKTTPEAKDILDKEYIKEIGKFTDQQQAFIKKTQVIDDTYTDFKKANVFLREAAAIRRNIYQTSDDFKNKYKKLNITKKHTDFQQLNNISEKIKKEELRILHIISKNLKLADLKAEAQKSDATINQQLININKSASQPPKIRGLENCGNTCFMNAVFQALFHTPELNKLLQMPFTQIPFNKSIAKEDSLLKIAHDVFHEYMKPGDGAISPKKLTEARPQFFPQFKIGDQEDALEFILAFFEQLGKELSVVDGKMTLNWKKEPDDIVYEDYIKVGGNDHYSLIDHWFGRYEKSEITKDDGTKAATYGYNTILTLAFSPEAKVSSSLVTLKSMYENYTKTEDMLDSPGNKDRTLSIQKGPQNLIVQLSRFEEDGSAKIQTPVDFPLDWKIATNNGDVNYELYAVVLQSGTLRGGHYTADIKVGPTWYHANDSSVQEITPQDVTSENKQKEAYLLFYHRK